METAGLTRHGIDQSTTAKMHVTGMDNCKTWPITRPRDFLQITSHQTMSPPEYSLAPLPTFRPRRTTDKTLPVQPITRRLVVR
jgi:hypothetical protein